MTKSILVVQRKENTLLINLAVGQFRMITLEGLQVFREDARFDTPPKWTAQNCTVVKIETSEDGTSCKVIALKKGTTTLMVTDENNATTPPLRFDIEVVPSPIVTFGVTIEPPSFEKPEPRIESNEAVPAVTPDDARFAEHVN